MEKKTYSILSYCEIPEELTEKEYELTEGSCDSFIEMKIIPKTEQEKYSSNFDLINWIIDTYPEVEGETILIHLDW